MEVLLKLRCSLIPSDNFPKVAWRVLKTYEAFCERRHDLGHHHNVKILMSSVYPLLWGRYIYPHISHFRDIALQSVRQTQAIHWILWNLSHFIHIYLNIINPCYLHITWLVQFTLQCTTVSLFPKKSSESKVQVTSTEELVWGQIIITLSRFSKTEKKKKSLTYSQKSLPWI